MITKYRSQTDTKAALEAAKACVIVNGDAISKTQQGHAHEADINNLVRAFGITKPMPGLEVYDPRYYGDLTDVPDLHTALMRIREARDHFNALPAKLRRRFNDTPANLWEFVNNPENLDEAVSLGLLSRAPEPPPPPPPVPPAA